MPRFLPDLEAAAAPEIVAFAEQWSGLSIESVLSERAETNKAFIFRCEQHRRHLVVAAWMRIAETDMNIVEPPFNA